MAAVVVVLLLALVLGGIGLLVEAARWALIIALVLLAIGIVMGFTGRGRATRH